VNHVTQKVVKITENDDFNEYLTKYCHGIHITKVGYFFLRKAYKINKEKQFLFCCEDFRSEFTPGNYRQMIHRYREIIELVIPGRPCFYQLKGVDVPKRPRMLTDKTMGDGMISILEDLQEQNPALHDIKIKFDSDIHKSLTKLGYEINPINHVIKLPIPIYDNNITVMAIVYPKTIQIDIGCTFKPFVYDIQGMIKLTTFLGRIYQYLLLIARESSLSDVLSWVITHYHFGIDGSKTYSGKSFHRTFEDMSCGFIRFYSKKLLDGNLILRLEQIHSPKTTLNQEIEKMILQNSVTN